MIHLGTSMRAKARLIGALVVLAVGLAMIADDLAAQRQGPTRIALKDVDTWAYQLQHIVPRLVAKDGFDVLVVDYSRDGTDAGALSRDDVATLRKRVGQPDRIILAYLSIGEAEDYRYYWNAGWSEQTASVSTPARPRGFLGAPDGASLGMPDKGAALAKLTAAAPPWLADENPEWRGNYLVRYWDETWQSIIFGAPSSYLDKIIAAGFDGVYLDKIDANDDWQSTRPTAEREMVDFVKKLAIHARARSPGFLIVPQNGEELLEFPDYVQIIDAIAKEDLLFGGASRKDGVMNPELEVLKSKRHLDKARRAKRPVLAVEYLDQLEQILSARQRLRSYGYIPFFARRALDAPPNPVPTNPTPKQ